MTHGKIFSQLAVRMFKQSKILDIIENYLGRNSYYFFKEEKSYNNIRYSHLKKEEKKEQKNPRLKKQTNKSHKKHCTSK